VSDNRISNLAKILVEYCIDVQPGDRVALMASTLASPLMLELQREVLRAGGHPHTQLSIPGSNYIFFTEANEAQLEYVSPVAELYLTEFEGLIQLASQANTKELSNIEPSRQAIQAKAIAPLMKAYMERTAEKKSKWAISMFPTPALAQDAEMSLAEFENFVYAATYADCDDPVGEWKRIHNEQQKIVDWLKGKQEVVVEGPNAELKMSIEGRNFINADGVDNMPSGEIFTSPVEDSMNGWIRFTYPAVERGREVAGVELKIENGKAIEATAEKNEEFLKAMLEVDEGASIVGEFAIGTNERIDRFTKNILFDEKIGGTIHLALGAGFKEIGGTNESGLHWDMICDMKDGGRIIVDGELFYDSGKFVIDLD
jgi:aminopeptidase